ncbi:MAG: Ppx/GppA family phosphatase, partial [Burkholderiaceae bacterium]|nr:Ppx/GppA family phosphatase [Burkholderiaceae bacterium]
MLLAAVDLGSNSFRLEIGSISGAHIERVGYWKETVRLAAGLDGNGRLTKRAIESACETLARMNERLRGMKPEQVRAVGTQTLRSAANVDEFLLEAQHALGYPIEVIAGREEARLVFEGCMHTLPPSPARRLVVDIGGASTELIVGRGFVADQAESFKVGCVNTSLRFFKDGQIDRASFKRAQVAAGAAIEEAVEQFSRARWDEAFGSSGTAGAISDILRAEGWTDGTITSEGLLRLRQAVISAGEVKRLRFATLKPERQEVLAGGAAVLCAVFDVLGVHEMRTARGALRVGVLYDLLGRRESRDLRDATVDRLQQRFGVDRRQAQRVGALAAQLYARLAPDAAEQMIKRLAWASALHEVGFAISHNDYHKHGAYLVQHGDLAGFSTSDQERIALLILAQRGNLKKVAAVLDDAERAAKILALRLAVVLCHARRDVSLPAWSLRSVRGAIELGLAADWLGHHPLTEYLL